ncbi:hypothetical protein F5888DRAFT_1888338 [Russula emetica]|nr:hypothetical protein F5888DRAFT_1888338 [Russula emetica]
MSQLSSSSTFQVLLNTALHDYKDKTGSSRVDHPFAKQFQYNSVEFITTILKEQTRIFRELRDRGKLLNSLTRLVDVLCSLSPPFLTRASTYYHARRQEQYLLASVSYSLIADGQRYDSPFSFHPARDQRQKNRIKALYDGVVPARALGPLELLLVISVLRPQISGITSVSADKFPLHLKHCMGTQSSGTTFKDKNVLITGVGKGSIGVEILKGLLSGGAHVIATTSRYSHATVEYYQGISQHFGSCGSALIVVPFNQGSKQDVEVLVDYIYMTLRLDLDYVIPFAAVPENGCKINGLDDKSELVPISCFWTHGTGLMSQSNMIAQEIETHGVHTFSAKEMAFNILKLMHPILFSIAQVEPFGTVNITPRANFRFEFPQFPGAHALQSLSHLCDVIDPEMSSSSLALVGPWGSSRTRWEMEHFDGCLKDGTLHTGWIDATAGDLVDDKDVCGKYKKATMSDAGVRFIRRGVPTSTFHKGHFT